MMKRNKSMVKKILCVISLVMLLAEVVWAASIPLDTTDAGSDKALDVDNVRLTMDETVAASITLSSLSDRQIVQRDGNNQASLLLSGTFSGEGTEIQARAVAIDENGTDTGWITIDADLSGESYAGTLDVSAGWYQIEVRLLNGTEVTASALLAHVGVGDIYITCGQSNSANFGDGTPSAADDRVSYLGLLTGTWVHADDPPGNPSAYPGRKGSPWPKLGDLLSAQDDVPIGFVSIGDGSSSVESWMPASDDNYPNLKTAVQYFSENGFKAVLWHQGEYDADDNTSIEDYVTRLETVIAASRVDAGWNIPWGVAQVSYPYTIQNVPLAQLQVIANDDLVFAGADTDTIGAAYRNGPHFTVEGLTLHAELWFDALNDAFPVSNDGLMAHWSLDEGSGSVAYDVAGNNYDGTITNESWISGVAGNALHFNGIDSSVSLPAEAFNSISNEITISMWAYGGDNQPQNNSVLYAVNASGDPVLNINLPWGDGNIHWDAGDQGGVDQINQTASSDEYKGKWNHWVFTKNADAGTMNIYLNGALWHSGTGMTNLIGTVVHARLGSAFDGSYYEGAVDDVRLYNYALSATTVLRIFSSYNEPPVAHGVSVSVFENDSISFALNGEDPEGSNLIYTAVSQPDHGTLTTNVALPNLIYLPDTDFIGTDSFTYAVSDGVFVSDSATVSIRVIEGDDRVLYWDTFDGDGLDENAGIGGGAAYGLLYRASWADSGSGLVFDSTRNHSGSRAVAYSTNTFQSINGFELTVNYNVSQVTDNSDNQFSFGLIRDDLDVSTYGFAGEMNPFGVWTQSDLYSVGLNVMADTGIVTNGLYANSGTNAVLLNAGTTVAGTDITIVMRIEDNGADGADVSWSVDGADQGSATIADFDFSKSYAFLTYAADQEVEPIINSVKLIAATEEPLETSTISVVMGSGGLVLSWDGDESFDVLTNADLENPNWGVSVENTTSPVTNAVGSEAQLFFKLSE
jgi:hypothetical protein